MRDTKSGTGRGRMLRVALSSAVGSLGARDARLGASSLASSGASSRLYTLGDTVPVASPGGAGPRGIVGLHVIGLTAGSLAGKNSVNLTS